MPKKILWSYGDFAEIANAKFNNKFTYVPWEGTIGEKDTFTYYCPIHDEQESKPYYHFRSESGCVPCGRLLATKRATKSHDVFIKEMEKKYGDIFDFKDAVYVNNRSKIKVYCKKCGNTKWTPKALELITNDKKGCPECITKAIYTKAYYKAHDIQDHECNLYVVRITCRETNEVFLKVGITKHDNIRIRFRGMHRKYLIETLYQEQSMFFKVFEKEQSLHLLLKEHSFKPLQKFKGYTECFSIGSLDIIESYLGVILDRNLSN